MKSFLALILSCSLLYMLGACAQSNSSSFHLIKKWQTDTSIRAPESVLWNAQQQFFYVSDINGDGSAKDGNGFISKLSPDGKIIQLHWADGLNAPKGMGQFGDEIYVADLDQLVIIDKKTGAVKTKINVPGATFLNDIAVDEKGNVYISDTRMGKVYRYVNGAVSEYIIGPEVKGANGLLVWQNKLWILTAGGIYNYNQSNKKLTLFSDEVKGGDGIAAVNDSELIVSRWIGEVYYVKADGHATKILDTKEAHKNTADCWYYADKHLLVIPTFTGNTVDAYQLGK